MLYVKDNHGNYEMASMEQVIHEAKRLLVTKLRPGVRITSPQDAKTAIQINMAGRHHEVFSCLFLNAQNRLIHYVEMFQGTICHTTVYARPIIRKALELNAAAVIFAHNHPSGDSSPSSEDISLTHRLKEILGVIDVKVLDHLVIGGDVSSLKELGHL
jgi:DNA repair protein RadC